MCKWQYEQNQTGNNACKLFIHFFVIASQKTEVIDWLVTQPRTNFVGKQAHSRESTFRLNWGWRKTKPVSISCSLLSIWMDKFERNMIMPAQQGPPQQSGLSLSLQHSIRCGATTNFNVKCLVCNCRQPTRIFVCDIFKLVTYWYHPGILLNFVRKTGKWEMKKVTFLKTSNL